MSRITPPVGCDPVPLTLPEASKKPDYDFGQNKHIPSPRVPPEVIDHILTLALIPCPIASIPDFHSIAPFTLASKDLRQIALRRYFYDITLETKPHWTGVFNFLKSQEGGGVIESRGRGFAWIKSLCASSGILSYQPSRLSSLAYLQTLSIDMAQEGLSTQHPRLKALFEIWGSTNVSLSLTSLTLSNLPRIDILLLELIAKIFARLTDLYLSCTERLEFSCCWACFEESLGCTVHSPIPDDFFDVIDMAEAFGYALKPLSFLTHLHLGVFLSDEQLLYSHIAHSLGDEENMGMVDGSGRCSICFESAVADVRMRELTASVTIARQLKAVRSVGWSTFFTGMPQTEVKNSPGLPTVKPQTSFASDIEEGDANMSEIDEDMKTTTWVLRTNGRVRVRRTPW